MEEERERMRQLLTEAVCTLCRSGMKFDISMRVEGLLAITVDEKEVVVVNINKSYEQPRTKPAESPSHDDQEELASDTKKQRRRRSQDGKGTDKRPRPGRHKRSASESSAEGSDAKVVKTEHAESAADDRAQMPWMLGEGSGPNSGGANEPGQVIGSMGSPLSHGANADNSQSQPSHSDMQGQIKIEIDSDSDDDISVLESWDSVVQGQGELIPLHPGSSAVPISMFSSDCSQPLAGTSQDFAQFVGDSSQYPPSFSATDSMDNQQQPGVMDLSSADIIENLRGKQSIAIAGYRYGLRSRGKDDTARWRCTQHSSTRCSAKLATKSTTEGLRIIRALLQHNHPPPRVTNDQLKYRKSHVRVVKE